MTDEAWWIDRGAGAPPEGPYATAEIRRLADTGDLGPRARVWSADSGGWRAPQFRDPIRRPARPVRAPSRAWLAVGSVAFAVLFAFAAGLIYTHLGDHLPPWLELTGWSLSGALLGIASLTAFVAWRRAARTAATPEFGSVVQVASVLFLIAGLALAAIEARFAAFMVPSTLAATQWTYDADRDAATGRIRIVGEIGPGFGARIETLLAASPSRPVVEITSYGGMIVEAQRAAKALEKHPGATVIARGHCASACITVLMGADRRLADSGMDLDFHATAPNAKTQDRLILWGMKSASDGADAYLEKRGVPQAFVDAANRAGPANVYRVPAVIALRAGVLTGLLSADQPVTPAEVASWGEADRPRVVALPFE